MAVIKTKVLTRFYPNNDEIVISVGKKCQFWKGQYVLDLSDSKDNSTQWLVNFVLKLNANCDGLFVANRLSVLSEVQIKVGDAAILDMNGWENCKVLLINENHIVDVKKETASTTKNRMVASRIGLEK